MKHICWKAVAGFSFLVWSMPAMAETVPMVRLAELEIAPENIEAYRPICGRRSRFPCVANPAC